MKKFVAVFSIILLTTLFVGRGNVFAAGGITLFTPYTGISVTPGETIDYSVDVQNDGDSIQSLTFEVDQLPKGWEHEITADGKPLRQLSVMPNSKQEILLEITVPLEVEKADYRYELVAINREGTRTELPLLTTVSEKGTYKTELTSEQPNMEGHADSTFSYSATLNNRTAEEQNYSLISGAPEGWGVQFKANGSNVTSVNVEPNGSTTVTIDVTPPNQVKADTYIIPIQASTGSTSANLELEAVITGTYDISISTPDGRLSADVTAGGDRTLDLVVENTGTTKLSTIDISANTPPGWETEFDNSSIAELEAGDKKTIKAIVTAPDEAIAGDYVVSFSVDTAETSDEASFRISVETSTVWGIVAVLIILGVLGGLIYVVKKYGRR
ncbi:NEW3 domain-containing protein [Bacillaceae bacterium S4-13-58]